MSSATNLPAGLSGGTGAPVNAGSETSFLFMTRTYRVFISYSHADAKWARWLTGRLESFRVPARFHGQKAPIGVVGARIAPVFRDRDELPTTSDLGETIRSALRQSATLVVICSPNSAKSRWVQEEILAFKRLGGSARVFAFIVAGEPKAAGTDADCFSPALRLALAPDGTLSTTPAEHVAADARPQGDGKEDAFVRLVAGLLGVGFDELRQREQQRRQRRLLWITGGSMAGMAVALGLAAVAWQARNDARRRQEQAEDLLEFMLGDLRSELKKVGQLNLLNAVGDKAIAYFDALDPRDLTDTALVRQAKALTQIGDIRIDQKDVRFAEAVRAYLAAYQRAAALVARHPRDGEMLFERAQAEYGIGNVYWKRGDLVSASEWMERYRESGAALVKLDPTSPRWQGELAYGHHNLAVIAVDRGNHEAARAGFLAELAMLERMSGEGPASVELLQRLADVHSWLGSVAEQTGGYSEAASRFGEQVKRLETLVQQDPRTAEWKVRLAYALSIQSSLLAITGRRSESLEWRRRAAAVIEPLVAKDPANRTWLSAALNLKLKEAMLRHADGDESGAVRLAAEARAGYERLHLAEPSARTPAGQLATALGLEAEIEYQLNGPGAAAAAERALKFSQQLMAEPRNQGLFLEQYARACWIAGLVAQRRGDGAGAARVWQAGWDAVKPRLAGSKNWHLLDPGARLLAALGRTAESRAIIEQLTGLGYQPLTPWP